MCVGTPPHRNGRATGFSLVELIGVLALAAALAAIASVSMSGAGRTAEFRDSLDRVRAADGSARELARHHDRAVVLTIDLVGGRIYREPEDDDGDPSARVVVAELARGVRVEQVLIGGRREGSAPARLVYSPRGLTRSFAVLLTGPADRRQWIAVAGLTGQTTLVDDRDLDPIFAHVTPPPPGLDAH